MTIATDTAIYGMILDIFGAFILARSFVVKRPMEVFRDVRSFGNWDFPITVGARNLLLSWLVQAYEAKTGAVMLLSGFVLQAVAQAQLLPKGESVWALLFLLLFAVVSLWLLFWLPRIFVRLAARQARRLYLELGQGTISDDWKREIPLRCTELNEIQARPGQWLKSGELKPPTEH